jgi:hypothetical protein
MTVITNRASPGAPSQNFAEQPVRNPLAGGIPFRSHATNPALTGPIGTDAQIRTIPTAIVDAAGGPTIRRQ